MNAFYWIINSHITVDNYRGDNHTMYPWLVDNTHFKQIIFVCTIKEHELDIWILAALMLNAFNNAYNIPKNARVRVAQWDRWLDYLTIHANISPMRLRFAPGFVNYKKGALDSQVIKLTSCLSMVGGSLLVFGFFYN